MRENNNLVIEAIKHYDCYSTGQKEVLTTLYNLSIDNITIIKVAQLSKITGYSRHMVYKSLRQFEQDGILKMSDGGQKLTNMFKFNQFMLEHIINVHNKVSQLLDYKKT